jgi:adhesin transport system outer membrane protein
MAVFKNGWVLMLNKDNGLLMSLPVSTARNLLCKLGGALLMVTAINAVAASNDPEFPEEMLMAIRSAIQAHPDVMIANSKMLSAKSQVEAGGYRWYPKAEVAVRTGERGDRYSTVGLNQTLWDNGKINADFEAAKAGELVALSGKDVAMQSVGMAAAIAYIDVARAREQKAVAEDNVNEHRKLHFSVLRRGDGGIGSKSDVTLTTSRLQQARAMEKQWNGAVARSEASYLSVVGAPAVAGGLPLIKSWEVAGAENGLVARVVERAPSMQRLREEVKVAEATVDSRRAQLFPTLYARVDNTHYFGSGPFDNDTKFSVNFQWQNDVALTQRFQVDAAQHLVSAAKQALESEQRILVQTASNYWADYTTAISRSEELNKFSESAAETVKLFKRQFTIGRRSWPEVTNTLQDLYSARSQQVDAKYLAMTSRMQIAFVGGEMDYLLGANGDALAK